MKNNEKKSILTLDEALDLISLYKAAGIQVDIVNVVLIAEINSLYKEKGTTITFEELKNLPKNIIENPEYKLQPKQS